MTSPTFRDDCLRELMADHERGASQLARHALGFLAQAARDESVRDVATLRAELDAFAERLQRARPSMVPIEHLVGRWRREVEALPERDLPQTRAAMIERAQSLVGDSQQAVAAVGRLAAELVPDGATVITHSLSSTVLEVLGQLGGREVKVIFSEARPRLEGHRFARWLSAAGVRGELVTDAQLGHHAARADVALVGADAVLADGSVVNKAGSYLLALAARDRGVPFYVCCESFKRTRRLVEDFELEEVDRDELGAPSLEGIEPRNVYFDITPARLVDAWIDETGVRRAWES
jgi:translation initiation factor eIF-2B subunit delta